MRILIVEDEPGVRETLRTGLSGYTGFRVACASGEDDLDLELAATCDLVVMDMHLGRGRDGLDLLEEIAGVNPLVKFLVISGRREVEVASRVVAASRTGLVSDVLIKPFTLEQLFIAVDRAVPTSGEAAARA